MDLSPPLEELLKARSQGRVRLAALPNQIAELEREAMDNRNALEAQASWWSRFWGNSTNEKLQSQWRDIAKLRRELEEVKSEDRQLSNRIADKKKAKQRFLGATLARQAADAQEKLQTAQREQFGSSAVANQVGEFDRQNFFIQQKDYRRGNPVDNYFRVVEGVVLEAFQHHCIFCSTSHDLTFDHFALTKNEGGNFALITADRRSIRLNIVVLCRGCNAAKAQTTHVLFFSNEQRTKALSCQKELLKALLSDHHFLETMRKWGVEMAFDPSSSA